jgi:hypothetical protein
VSSNLWPDFQIAQNAKSPKAVVEQLGAGLEQKTDDLVRFYFTNTSIREGNVHATFALSAPNLGYSYPFLRIYFPVDRFYPVTIVPDKMEVMRAKDEDELTVVIKSVFNAPSTIETIQRLMTLASNG